jgi:RecA-family ATPase
MLLDLQTLAKALGGEISAGQLRCPGPGHSAADRSLSIRPDPNAPDGFLVNTFSPADDPIACKDYVRQKLGLPAFKPSGGSGRRRATDDAIERALMAAVQSRNDNKPKGRIVATFDYTDADGTLLYQVVKYDSKIFSQRRPDGNGSWIWSLRDVRRVLYRWPELLKFPMTTTFVTEGEKDSDRLWSLNLVATTVACGTWDGLDLETLRGRELLILEDNDEAGVKRALEAAAVLYPIANYVKIVRLPGLADKEDVSDWLDKGHTVEELNDFCNDTAEWAPNDTDTTAADATDTAKEETTSKLLLPFINIAEWHERPVPERVWTVKDRIPGSNVTLLSGEGSVGKSILSLHLATAVVLGRDWLQSLPEPGPVIVACCEDDTDELWRRLDLIFQHYGAAYTDFKDLHVSALAGEETLMAVPDRNGIMQTTKLFGRTREAACDLKPRLIVLDNSADVFGGNENDRAQVRQFIGHLRGMAIAAGAGVLLTSHPSLTGISTGTGLSGSTAWNASVRSRLYFKRATTEKDEEPDPDLRVLEVMKANYGPVGETITLRWTNGLFLPVAGISNLDKLAAERRGEELFLKLLEQFTRQGRNTCEKETARNYAPRMFSEEKEARDAGVKKADFKIAMSNLFNTGKIQQVPYGSPCRGTFKLVIK